jgi:uncharacterized protein YcbK (DUF882 family)
MTRKPAFSRRTLLRHMLGTAVLGAGAALALPARAAAARSLSLVHTHTGERIELVYASAAAYDRAALDALNHFLRDHYSGDVGTIDPALFDQLHRVQVALGPSRPFEVISGYRCPATNDRLRSTRGGGVARHSLHLEGRAIDVRLPGVALAGLRDAARALRAGGVGFYPHERFVHLDTGRVRAW